MKQTDKPTERRHELRTTKLPNHRAEFKFTGVPVYQLKVRDLSAKGVGIVVRADSNFLKMIQVGQELDIKMIPGTGAAGAPDYQRSRIEHVSELKEGRFRGHMVVGLSISNKITY
jgi:hypothetical protein